MNAGGRSSRDRVTVLVEWPRPRRPETLAALRKQELAVYLQVWKVGLSPGLTVPIDEAGVFWCRFIRNVNAGLWRRDARASARLRLI